MATSVWKVTINVNGILKFDVGRYAVLILNRPINVPNTAMLNLWDEACYRATADGGTDRWYDFVKTVSPTCQPKHAHPDLVSGDFDSVRPETLRLCREDKERAVTVIHTPDQDKTDFTKALEEIYNQTKGQIDSVIAVVESSGRLDHIMSNLNTLYTYTSDTPVRLYLLGSDSLTWLMPAGAHTVQIPPHLVQARATCGLIPLGTPCRVTTSGLQWNLNDDKMEFGGLISTCNTYSETSNGTVTVDTDSPILWTMSLFFETQGDS